MRIHVTMYYKPYPGMSEKAKKMEGGPTDARGKPLRSLEEYLMGDADYVSLARDYLAGPPGSDTRFTKYGTRVRIPEIEGLMGWDYIEFRLVDTGGHFFGKGKVGQRYPVPLGAITTPPMRVAHLRNFRQHGILGRQLRRRPWRYRLRAGQCELLISRSAQLEVGQTTDAAAMMITRGEYSIIAISATS